MPPDNFMIRVGKTEWLSFFLPRHRLFVNQLIYKISAQTVQRISGLFAHQNR